MRFNGLVVGEVSRLLPKNCINLLVAFQTSVEPKKCITLLTEFEIIGVAKMNEWWNVTRIV